MDTSGSIALGPLLRTRTFRLLFLAVGLLSLAFFTPFVFLASYAEDHGIGPAATSIIVGLIGVTSTVGRLVLAAVGGGIGEVRMYQLCYALMACSFAVWLFAGSSAAALIVYSILMGTGYGGFVALAPAVLAREFGPERLGGLIGTLYSAFAIGSATSPPLIGWLTDTVGAAPGILFALVAASGAFVATLGLRVTT
jgi:MFS family permease